MSKLPFGFTGGAGDDSGDDYESSGASGPQGFDLSSLGAMLQQMGAMMQRAEAEGDGAVSWSTIRDTARSAISGQGDPAVSDSERTTVNEAVGLAQTWLDGVLPLPASAPGAVAWCSSEWLEGTLRSWRPFVDPIAEGLANTVSTISTEALPGTPGELPAELAAMLGPMLEMAKKMSAVSTGVQIGNGFAALASEMLTAGDTGLPLQPDLIPTLLPRHITDFASANELPPAEFMVFMAVRESALQRLYHAYPWLRTEISDAIARYARGINIDSDAIREAVDSIDPSDPASMQQLMASGAFRPATTEAQKQSLERIELLLATVEGWVSAVTEAAVDARLGRVEAMTETMNRRRAAGGPAELTFANLVGLELRPRLARNALGFWRELLELKGAQAHEQVWAHPDLLPSADELGDVASFLRTRSSQPDLGE